MSRLAVTFVVALLLTGCSATDEPEEAAAPSRTAVVTMVDGAGRVDLDGPWRTEVWRDVQLKVPADWAVGYGPVPDGAGALLCGVGPLGQANKPYVGRPGYGSDMCLSQDLDELAMPVPGVWFGSPLPVGEKKARSGLVQTTVAAGPTRITVAGPDADLVDRIVRSVTQVGEDANGCPARPRPERRLPFEGYGDPTYLSVCLYDTDDPEGTVREWTDRLPRPAAVRLLAAVEDRAASSCPARCLPPCPDAGTGQVVLLRVHSEDMYGDDAPRDHVVRLGACPTMEVAPTGQSLELTPDLVRPWATDGVATYVVGSSAPRLVQQFFRPVWG